MSFSLLATRRTRSSPLATPWPALSPGRVWLSVFPSAGLLSSTASATGTPVLFGSFAGTTSPSDFSWSCISGVRPQPPLSGPPGDRPDGRARDLPVLAQRDSTHALVLRPRGVRQQLAMALLTMLPSASTTASAPRIGISGLNSPACVYPCQRFACALAGADA